MIKIFILNIVVSVIHFVSVETTAHWFEKIVKSGYSYSDLTLDSGHAITIINSNVASDPSTNCKIKFLGLSPERYKSKIFKRLLLKQRSVATDYKIRFKYFESGNSPPEHQIAVLR